MGTKLFKTLLAQGGYLLNSDLKFLDFFLTVSLLLEFVLELQNQVGFVQP